MGNREKTLRDRRSCYLKWIQESSTTISHPCKDILLNCKPILFLTEVNDWLFTVLATSVAFLRTLPSQSPASGIVDKRDLLRNPP